MNLAHDPLNRDDGGLLPTIYLHVINKKKRKLVNVQTHEWTPFAPWLFLLPHNEAMPSC